MSKALQMLLAERYRAGKGVAGRLLGGSVEGTPFGRYRLVELLGQGGMGEVWRAYDTAIDRMVALKMLLPRYAQDEKFEQRFRREARAAARLDDPHVVPIHDVGEAEGRLYVTMRLIKGRDLQEVLSEGPLEPARAVRIVEQVAKALHAAHEAGLVHRDVKPSNVLLGDDDYAYLIDFGIARTAGEEALTGSGAPVGSWHYMAPERLGGGEVDARTDIYALACVLYECLTGRRPFPGDSLESQVAAHLTAAPPQASTSNPTVPLDFDAVIATGMAKKPDRRYATSVEFAKAAHDALTGPLSRPHTAPAHEWRSVQPRTPSAATIPDGPAKQERLLRLRYAARSDRGLDRGKNDDSVYAGERLVAVADGIGEPLGGDMASHMIIHALVRLDDEEPGKDVLDKLGSAIHQGNLWIAEWARKNPDYAGMGTTLTAIVFAGDTLGLAHIGGSRAYLLRNGKLTQVTEDEVGTASTADTSGLSASERSGIMRRLTGDEVPTLKELKVRLGDRYLLCTHGLTDCVGDESIKEALQIPDVGESSDKLIELAICGGGSDNVTVAVVDVVRAD